MKKIKWWMWLLGGYVFTQSTKGRDEAPAGLTASEAKARIDINKAIAAKDWAAAVERFNTDSKEKVVAAANKYQIVLPHELLAWMDAAVAAKAAGIKEVAFGGLLKTSNVTPPRSILKARP